MMEYLPQFSIFDILLDRVEGRLPVDFKLGATEPRDFHDQVHRLVRSGLETKICIWVGGITTAYFVKSTRD